MGRGLERESGADGRSWYSPHRALIALGTILISIAIAGGLLGVTNATHAVQETATLSNRYLVLQPPVRTLRADVAVFQGHAESAFAGADATPTFLAKAVQASDATDQAYGTVGRLFDKLGDEDLEPHLAASMAAYVAARARLTDFVSVGTSSAEKAAIVTAERTSDTNLDNAIANSQAAVTKRLEATATQAQVAGNAAKTDLLLCLLVGGVLGIGFTSLFAWKALTVEREDDRNRDVRVRIIQRNEFEVRLQRALEMAKSESSVYDLVSQALVDTAPGVRSELLLTDSSKAYFRQVLVSSEATDGSGCGVVSPDNCPAATHGQTMVFPTSKAIDACPNLRDRNCSAACIPVSIGGNSVGVFHVKATDGSPSSDEIQQNVEVVGRRASERLAGRSRSRRARPTATRSPAS